MNSRHESLPIGQIELDQTNPRIQRALNMYGSAITPERIALALKEGSDDEASGTTLSRLKNSIIKNQGIINPIFVNEKDGRFICIEGNTRLLIYQELNEQEPNSIWQSIPCLIYTDAKDEAIDAIRLQAHLVGPRQWDPYSKARYLHYLWNVEYLTHDKIIQYCGGNKNTIRDSIAAYNMVEDIYKPLLKDPEDFDHTRFSGFVEYQNPKIYNAVYEAGFKDENFAMWLHDQKIARLEHVRRLPEIMKNEEAKEVFLRKDSKEAIIILNRPSLDGIMRDNTIEDVIRALSRRIDGIEYEEMEQCRKQADTLTRAIDDALRHLEGLKNEIAK